MLADRYDSPLSTTSAAARDAYVDGVDRFISAQAGAEEALMRALDADPDFAMGHLALARFRQANGRAPDAKAPLAEARARTDRVTAREAAQIATLGLLIDGKGADAYRAMRAHVLDHPRDILMAQPCLGVFGLIGFSGQPGREAEQLAFTTALAPHYGDDWYFLCQHAFAQTEAGQQGPARETIERSMAQNPANAHGAHIKAHIHYETGETEAGFAFLDQWRDGYDKSGQLHCHISWHIALWSLERGDIERMWQVIDADIAPGAAWGPQINVLTDTAAILYRAALAGIDVPPERWQAVSDYAVQVFPEPGIAFADTHGALAHALAGRGEALAKVVSDARGPAGDLVRDLAEAFGAIARADWAEAVRHLTPVMADHARIGGSRAQRDLIEFAMASALLRLGRGDEAQRLLATRRPITAHPGIISGL